MEQYISIGRVCFYLGISLSTAYRWLKARTLVSAFLTYGGHRRFSLLHIQQTFLPTKIAPSLVCYSRVSSHDQKNDLLLQEHKLLHFAKQHYPHHHISSITDLGSGLNYNKKGLKQLIALILSRSVNVVILNHKDRLLRFGSEIIFNLCSTFHIKVVILEDTQPLSFKETLSRDVIELMTVFCAKLYGKRSHKNKLPQLSNI